MHIFCFWIIFTISCTALFSLFLYILVCIYVHSYTQTYILLLHHHFLTPPFLLSSFPLSLYPFLAGHTYALKPIKKHVHCPSLTLVFLRASTPLFLPLFPFQSLRPAYSTLPQFPSGQNNIITKATQSPIFPSLLLLPEVAANIQRPLSPPRQNTILP